ncbi:MAG TPA: sugar phosphate isomerase/epimerase [Micromonosporaceae bacterium]|nr:sugar phosphate isomerase/epimerase [Micromonosporaceae bacterium]
MRAPKSNPVRGALSRRRFLGTTAGLTLGAAAGGIAPLTGAAAAAAPNGRLIPAGKVGTITFTQRDVPGRLGIASGSPTMGYLGGDNFPQDPTDLGPLVPLPGGWRELFEFFANVGIKQVEFAGYGQNANNPGGNAGYPNDGNAAGRAAYLEYAGRIRGFLDEFGLEAIGNHGFIPNTWFGPNSAGGTMSAADELRLRTELEFATILGTPFMGTGNDPTSANNRNIEPWTIACEKWTALNQISVNEFGIHMYTHNHSPAYNFLQDGPMVTVTEDRVTGAPIAPTQVRAESGKRLMQHYLDNTDPGLVQIEMDIYWAHVAQHQWRWRYDENGARVEDIFDPLATVARQTQRYPLYHAKDGDRTLDPPGVGNGYNFVPFGDASSDIDFETFFSGQGAKGYHNPNYEQDNAPGGSADPGRSLRFTEFSASNMNNLRG